MNIGERLKKVRNLYGHSQDAVAKAISIKRSTYQSYENGRAEPAVTILVALSEFYGYYSIDILLGRMSQPDYFNNIMRKYRQASPDNRKIVDYVLSLKD